MAIIGGGVDDMIIPDEMQEFLDKTKKKESAAENKQGQCSSGCGNRETNPGDNQETRSSCMFSQQTHLIQPEPVQRTPNEVPGGTYISNVNVNSAVVSKPPDCGHTALPVCPQADPPHILSSQSTVSANQDGGLGRSQMQQQANQRDANVGHLFNTRDANLGHFNRAGSQASHPADCYGYGNNGYQYQQQQQQHAYNAQWGHPLDAASRQAMYQYYRHHGGEPVNNRAMMMMMQTGGHMIERGQSARMGQYNQGMTVPRVQVQHITQSQVPVRQNLPGERSSSQEHEQPEHGYYPNMVQQGGYRRPTHGEVGQFGGSYYGGRQDMPAVYRQHNAMGQQPDAWGRMQYPLSNGFYNGSVHQSNRQSIPQYEMTQQQALSCNEMRSHNYRNGPLNENNIQVGGCNPTLQMSPGCNQVRKIESSSCLILELCFVVMHDQISNVFKQFNLLKFFCPSPKKFLL